MNITISARKTTAKESFKNRAEQKLAKLDRFFDDEAAAVITVTNEGERETVEVAIQSRGYNYRAEKTTSDRLTALDAVVDSLFKQIVKNKEKLKQRLRSNAFEAPDAMMDYEPEDYKVAKVKRFTLKPMTVDEAILQMNMIGHEFYVFRNSDQDAINVVYKRRDGQYGVIEPE